MRSSNIHFSSLEVFESPRRLLSSVVAVAAGIVIAACGLIACGGSPGPRGPDRQGRGGDAAGQGDGPVVGARSAQPGKSEPASRDEHTYYARNYWFEIPTVSHAGEVWQMPQCERARRTGDRVAPASAASEAYNAPGAAQPTATALAAALTAAVRTTPIGRAAPGPARDPRLDELARELAPLVPPTTRRLPVRLVEFMMRHKGMIEPTPEVLVMWGPLYDLDAMVKQLQPELPAIFDVAPFNVFGVGSAQWNELGAGVVVLLFQTRFVDTAPIPRALPTGGVATLSGSVRFPYTDPDVVVVRDNGDRLAPPVTRAPGGAGVGADAGDRFRAEVSCRDYRGRQRVLVRARAPQHAAAVPSAPRPVADSATDSATGHATDPARGHRADVIASFPVYCGTRPPASVRLERAEGEEQPDVSALSEATAEAYLARMINRERRRCGLPRLPIHRALSEAARAHSREQAARGRLSHTSPTTGNARDRVLRAGVRSAAVQEFLIRTYDLREVVQELLETFDYRAAVLSTDSLTLGVGVAITPAGGARELFVTQLVARIPRAGSADEVHRVVAARLRRRRGLVRDSELDQAAREVADRLAGGTPVEIVVDRATLELRRRKTRFMEVKILVWTLADADSFELGPVASDNKLTHVGSAVVRGTPSSSGEDTYHVAVILGKLREGEMEP